MDATAEAADSGTPLSLNEEIAFTDSQFNYGGSSYPLQYHEFSLSPEEEHEAEDDRNWMPVAEEAFHPQFDALSYAYPPVRGGYVHQQLGGPGFESVPVNWAQENYQYADSGNGLPVPSTPLPATSSNLFGVGIDAYEEVFPDVSNYASQPTHAPLSAPAPSTPALTYGSATPAPTPVATPGGEREESRAIRCSYPNCAVTFQSEKDRERHETSVHNKPDADQPVPPGWYECICGRRWFRKDLFRRHLPNCACAITKPAKLNYFTCRCQLSFAIADRERFATHTKTCGDRTRGRRKRSQ